MKSWGIPLLLIVLSLGSLAAAPYLSVGDEEAVRRREASRDAIFALSQMDRANLERNYDYYVNRMTAEERQKMRDLHAALQAESQEVRDVVKIYDQWLRTLDAPSRDHLFTLTDPAERIEEMRRLVRVQLVQNSTRLYSFLIINYRDQPLSSEALSQVMAALYAEMRPYLPADAIAEIDSQEGLLKYQLMMTNLTRISDSPPIGNGPPQRGDGQALLLRSQVPEPVRRVAARLGELTLNEAARSYITQTNERQGYRLLQVLYTSMIAERERMAYKKENRSRPTTEQLKELFQEIPNEEERLELLQREAVDFQSALREGHALKIAKIEIPRPDEIARNFVGATGRRGGRGFFFQGGRGGPGGPGGPGGGGRGGRGRDDNQNDGDRDNNRNEGNGGRGGGQNRGNRGGND